MFHDDDGNLWVGKQPQELLSFAVQAGPDLGNGIDDVKAALRSEHGEPRELPVKIGLLIVTRNARVQSDKLCRAFVRRVNKDGSRRGLPARNRHHAILEPTPSSAIRYALPLRPLRKLHPKSLAQKTIPVYACSSTRRQLTTLVNACDCALPKLVR